MLHPRWSHASISDELALCMAVTDYHQWRDNKISRTLKFCCMRSRIGGEMARLRFIKSLLYWSYLWILDGLTWNLFLLHSLLMDQSIILGIMEFELLLIEFEMNDWMMAMMGTLTKSIERSNDLIVMIRYWRMISIFLYWVKVVSFESAANWSSCYNSDWY